MSTNAGTANSERNASSRSAAGGLHTHERLGRKIRSQAAQLADLTERLIQQEAYSRLVETRLLEFDNSHTLPVTPQLLDRTGGHCGSRRRSAVSNRNTDGRCHSGHGGSGNRLRGEQAGEEARDLRRGNETAQERLKDAAQLIRQLRGALERRDNEAKMATERARNFQRESSDLRRKLSSIGSGGGGGGGTRVAVGSREPVPGRTPSIAEASGPRAGGASVGGRSYTKRCDNQGAARQELGELEAEKEALLDYVQELLERVGCLETTSAGLERERSELSKRLEHLKGSDQAAEEMRHAIGRKDRDVADVRKQLKELHCRGEAERSEKEEMGRLYKELLEQLRASAEEKEHLQSKARGATTQRETDVKASEALREQLNRCLRRLSDVEKEAADKLRHSEGETMALKNALAGADTKLSLVENLEADAMVRGKELKECRKEMLLREEEIKKERSHTQHLVGVLGELETESARVKKQELGAVSRGKELERELCAMESKVGEIESLCEELQKRVVSLSSGRETDELRRRLTAASELAERQDQLLEEASTRLETLQSESRRLQEELYRAEEHSRNAKNVLEPVLLAARSHLLMASPTVESHASRDPTPVCMTSGHTSQLWRSDPGNDENDDGLLKEACNCGNGRLLKDSVGIWGDDKKCSWTAHGDRGHVWEEGAVEDIREVTSVASLAQAAAAALSTLLSQGTDGRRRGGQKLSKSAAMNTTERPVVRPASHLEDDTASRALHTSDLTEPLEKITKAKSPRPPLDVSAVEVAPGSDRRGVPSNSAASAPAVRSQHLAAGDEIELGVSWDEDRKQCRPPGQGGRAEHGSRVIRDRYDRWPERDTRPNSGGGGDSSNISSSNNSNSISSSSNGTPDGIARLCSTTPDRMGDTGGATTVAATFKSPRLSKSRVSFEKGLRQSTSRPIRDELERKGKYREPGPRDLTSIFSFVKGAGIKTDPESMRRMDSILRGQRLGAEKRDKSWRGGDCTVNTGAIRGRDFELEEIRRRSCLQPGSSRSPATETWQTVSNTTITENSSPRPLGSPSPSAVKINERIRGAQAVLKTLRSAG